jgi:hypothetical protein
MRFVNENVLRLVLAHPELYSLDELARFYAFVETYVTYIDRRQHHTWQRIHERRRKTMLSLQATVDEEVAKRTNGTFHAKPANGVWF